MEFTQNKCCRRWRSFRCTVCVRLLNYRRPQELSGTQMVQKRTQRLSWWGGGGGCLSLPGASPVWMPCSCASLALPSTNFLQARQNDLECLCKTREEVTPTLACRWQLWKRGARFWGSRAIQVPEFHQGMSLMLGRLRHLVLRILRIGTCSVKVKSLHPTHLLNTSILWQEYRRSWLMLPSSKSCSTFNVICSPGFPWRSPIQVQARPNPA